MLLPTFPAARMTLVWVGRWYSAAACERTWRRLIECGTQTASAKMRITAATNPATDDPTFVAYAG